MKHCIQVFVANLVRALFEFVLILVPAAFGIAGRSLMVFAIFLGLVCIVRNFLKRIRWLRRVAAFVFFLLVLFSLDGLSILWPFLYNGGLGYFIVYLGSIPLGTYVAWRWRPLGLRWWHGTLVASHLVLAAMSGILELSYPENICEQVKQNPHVTTLVPYDFEETVTPRYVVVTPDEKTIFVANRTQATQSDRGLFAVEITDPQIRFVDLDQDVPAHIVFDPVTGHLLVVTYRELEGSRAMISRNVPATAKLIWVNRQARVTGSVALDSAGDLYSFVIPGETGIDIVYHSWLYHYDRWSGRLTSKKVPDDGMAHAITDLLVIDGQWFYAYGGSFVQFLMTPAVFRTAKPDAVAERKRHKHFGYMVLAYDEEKRQVLAISSFGNTIDILDFELTKIDEIKIDGVVRRIATDADRRRGYAGRYLAGDLLAFDLDTHELKGRVLLGKNIRTIHPLSDGRVIAGSKCGVFLLEQAAFSLNTEPLE